MPGIMNNSPANAFAYRVMIGVTDLDQGVSGILNDRPANGVAYRIFFFFVQAYKLSAYARK